MIRLKYLAALTLLLTLSVLISTPVLAAGSGALVVVYNSGRAQIQEARTVTLPDGLAAIVFSDVPSTLDPTSVRAVADGITVIEVGYDFTPITERNLLDAYVGKEFNVILPDPADANGRITRKAKLLSNREHPIFMIGKDVYVGEYDGIMLPEMPKGLSADPILTLTAESEAAGKKDLSLSYLMGGLNWRADYTLTVGKGGKVASIESWATVTNSSGKEFKSADLRLVAGEVQRSRGGNQYARNAPMMAKAEMVMDAAPAPAAQESFSQYHVYTLERPVTLPQNGTKQVNLFSAPKVAVDQELTSRFNSSPRQFRGEVKQGVESALIFKNTKKDGLGMPMPGGLVRVFMPTADGTQMLAGEANVGHTAKDKDVRLVLGRSFDVSVERIQTAYKKTGKQSFEMSWKVTAKNANALPQNLKLEDSFPGEWEIVKADAEYVKKDAGTIVFDLAGLGKQEKVINYTVRIRY